MNVSRPCSCHHHVRSHTYTAEGNVGRCLALDPTPTDKTARCQCATYTPTAEEAAS